MKSNYLLVLFISFMLLANNTSAGTGSGIVTIIGLQDCCGAVGPYFVFNTSVRSAASCTDSNQYFAGRVDTDLGKAMYKIVVSAYESGRPIIVNGKGTCLETRNAFEDIDWINVKVIPD